MPPVLLDVCCGCGGLSLGMRHIFKDAVHYVGVDVWAEAARLYAERFGEAYAADVADTQSVLDAAVGGRRVFAVVGGPPCQPFSRANVRGKGVEDPRASLVFSILDLVRRLIEQGNAPSLVLFEQAPTLASTFRGVLSRVGAQLESAGYDTQACVVNMCVYGVPQRRRRTIIIGLRRSDLLPRPPASRFADPSAALATPAAVPGAMWDETITPDQAAERKLLISDTHWKRILEYERASNCHRPRDVRADEPCRTVTVSNIMSTTNDCLRVVMPGGHHRRKLTFEEVEAIMTLPRGWTLFRSAHTSNRTRVKFIGNAVPPRLFGALFTPEMRAWLLDALRATPPAPGSHLAV